MTFLGYFESNLIQILAGKIVKSIFISTEGLIFVYVTLIGVRGFLFLWQTLSSQNYRTCWKKMLFIFCFSTDTSVQGFLYFAETLVILQAQSFSFLTECCTPAKLFRLQKTEGSAEDVSLRYWSLVLNI